MRSSDSKRQNQHWNVLLDPVDFFMNGGEEFEIASAVIKLPTLVCNYITGL